MNRFARLTASAVVGASAAMFVSHAASAAPAPNVAAIADATDAQTSRRVLVVLGQGLSRFKTFALKRADTTDAGAVDLLFKSGSTLTLGLPAQLAPGTYSLELRFGKTGLQTYSVTVKDDAVLHLAGGDTMSGRLVVNSDDGVVFSGTSGGNGTLSASGAGTRFVWFPTKGALRAGTVDGAQWDSGAMGAESVAMGLNTTASGLRSAAFGDGSVASGFAAFAMGGSTSTASGAFATAMGYDAIASGDDAVSMGKDTRASGANSVAMGNGANASGISAVAMGAGSAASGDGSFAAGFNTVAGSYGSTAMGAGSTASGGYSVAMGFNTTASNDDTAAFGASTVASGGNSFAAGLGSVASGLNSAAVGEHTAAQAAASFACGRFNVAAGDSVTPTGTDPVFIVGNGTADDARSNALALLRNGDMTIAGTLTENSDARLKSDVVGLSGVLEKLTGVRAVGYRFSDGRGPAGAQIGLLAQEVRDAFPELVREGADGTLSVAYGNFTAVLLAAVKEQQSEIAALRREIEQIRKDIAARPAAK